MSIPHRDARHKNTADRNADPDLMPADPRDQKEELAYWRSRGIRPAWADRIGMDQLVTRAELMAIVARLTGSQPKYRRRAA